MLVAQDVLHSLCFLLVSLLQFFLAFGSGSLHRLQGLQKNKKHPGRTHKTTKGTQQCLGAGLSSEDCFWGGLCFWIRKPSSATRTAKNKQTPEESTKNKPNDSQNVWAQDFLQRLRFLCLLYVFVIFGSGSFHQLLGLQKKQKHLRKQQKLQENKNAKGFSGMSGPRIFFLQSVWFFLVLQFFILLHFFFGFWIRKLSSATRIAKNKKPLRKTKKPKDSKECLGAGLSSEASVFVFDFGGRPHRSENKRILLLTVSLCSCFLPPSPKNLKSSSWGRGSGGDFVCSIPGFV